MNQRQWLNSGIIILACSASLAHAQLNGGFETLDEDNWATNWIRNNESVFIQSHTNEAVPPVTNKYAIFREPGSGGLGRIYQPFVVPTGVNPKLRFQFQFSGKVSRSTPIPPDSFAAFLIADPPSGPPEFLFSISNPSFIHSFLYMDSDHDNPLPTDASVDISSIGGVYTVQVDLNELLTFPPGTTFTLEFGLASAANGVESFAILDGLIGSVDAPEEDCGYDDDHEDPFIDCPDDIVSPSSDPDDSGWATATDNCDIKEDGIVYDDDFHCGCPSVVHRTWTAYDTANPPPEGNSASCGPQIITNLESESDFYICLENLFGQCFSEQELHCNCNNPVPQACTGDGLPLNMRINGACTIAEMLTECFKEKMRNGGDIQTCAVNLADFLRDQEPPLICQQDLGPASSCVADKHAELLALIQSGNYQDCRGGPIGMEPCGDATHCDDDDGDTVDSCCQTQFGNYCVHERDGEDLCPIPPPPTCSNF